MELFCETEGAISPVVFSNNIINEPPKVRTLLIIIIIIIIIVIIVIIIIIIIIIVIISIIIIIIINTKDAIRAVQQNYSKQAAMFTHTHIHITYTCSKALYRRVLHHSVRLE